ncbi:MAG: hypothetical protein ACXWAV_09215, partial [Chthoniobacterales bacterium]
SKSKPAQKFSATQIRRFICYRRVGQFPRARFSNVHAGYRVKIARKMHARNSPRMSLAHGNG